MDQPEINVGLVGHIDHGKTTLTQALTGKWTDVHSEEIKRGITIRLGYADATFYYCQKCKEYTSKPKCKCGGKAKELRKVSFVDAPGHETLMATMLSGAAIMDGAILLIAANEPCPQPQTKEHLMALEIIGLKNIVIVQNKIDLIPQEKALENYKKIKEFVKGTIAENAPIIPISAQQNINIGLVIEAIEKNIPTPKRDPKKSPLMLIARSFDINKPNTEIEKLVGGVLGGALKYGILKIDEDIEIKPGRKIEKQGKVTWQPIKTKIIGLKTGGKNVKQISPGGSVAILTSLDPGLTKADNLSGNIAGKDLPPTWNELTLKPHLLERVVGSKEELKVDPIKKLEPLVINVNASTTVGTVAELHKNQIKLILKTPVCSNKTDRITISRKFGARWRLIGWAEIV